MLRASSRFLVLGSMLVSACTSLPDPAPRPDFAPNAPASPDAWTAGPSASVPPTGDWVASFGDPALDALVTEALAQNPALDGRAALLNAAEAFTRVARAGRRPSLSASASTSGLSRGIELAGDIDRVQSEAYGLGLDASWEPDFWGRIGAGVREAEANFAASEADLRAAELSIAARAVIAYLTLAEARSQLDVAKANLDARDRIRALTERRVQSGVSDPLDVRTARSTLAAAEAVLALREQAAGEAARDLEILVGRYPANAIETTSTLPVLGALNAEGNPVMLLARRPDIAAAEARLEAAGLRADQARLAMRPSINFSASLDSTQATLEDALNPELLLARLIGSLVQPLYTGGRLDAQRDAAVAQAEAAVADYASQTLNAWGEVENAIAADAFIARQEAAQARALEEARFAEELAERQYINGTVSVFNLIDAQTRRLNAESDVISARARRAINRVSYHLAMGGAAIEPPPAP